LVLNNPTEKSMLLGCAKPLSEISWLSILWVSASQLWGFPFTLQMLLSSSYLRFS